MTAYNRAHQLNIDNQCDCCGRRDSGREESLRAELVGLTSFTLEAIANVPASLGDELATALNDDDAPTLLRLLKQARDEYVVSEVANARLFCRGDDEMALARLVKLHGGRP